LELSGLQATSFRIGQISGGLSNGAWATSDWVPILVKSAINMNALPAATGVGRHELYQSEPSLIAYLSI
jgi:thioester reductase-like protein